MRCDIRALLSVCLHQFGHRFHPRSLGGGWRAERRLGRRPRRHQHGADLTHRKHPRTAHVLPAPRAAHKGQLKPVCTIGCSDGLNIQIVLDVDRFPSCPTSRGSNRVCRPKIWSTSVWGTWTPESSRFLVTCRHLRFCWVCLYYSVLVELVKYSRNLKCAYFYSF